MKEPWVGLNADKLMQDTSTSPHTIRLITGKFYSCCGHRNRDSHDCLYCKIDELTAEIERLRGKIGYWQHEAGACREIEEIRKAESKAEEYKAALEYVEANTKEPAILYVVSEVLREEK